MILQPKSLPVLPQNMQVPKQGRCSMVSLKSCTKKFGSFTALDAITLTVNKGEFFALLGPNGAGKTTLVRLILGFSRPTSGSVSINDIPSNNSISRKRVGYLAEHNRLPPFLTGWEYLQRNGELLGLSGSNLVSHLNDLLHKTGMIQSKKKKISSYSKGMLRRIGLAAALIGEPQLLILDEPVSGLDPIGIHDIRQVLEDLKATKVTLILNSHLLSEVEKLCDTVAIIDKGSILMTDAIEKIVGENETLEDVFIRLVKGENEPPH